MTMFKRFIPRAVLIATATVMSGCGSTQPQTVFLQAHQITDPPPPVVREIAVPVAVPQWRHLPDTQPAPAAQTNSDQLITSATRAATQRPGDGEFVQAVQTYAYAPGMVYQVIASPGHVTTILLEPGEQLISKVCGDTAQWLVGDTHSGSSQGSQILVVVKPLKSDLQTNLVLATDRRVYQIDLQSMAGVYHSAVQWTYPADFARQLADEQRQQNQASQTVIDPTVTLADLDFSFSIRAEGDKPDWMPIRVFSDGHKTYIAFPRDLDAMEAPPLFLLSRKGDAQLVNYRQRGNYYIVDQVIREAQLRLGEAPQQIVTIEHE